MQLEKLLQFSTDRRADDYFYYVNPDRISYVEDAVEGGVHIFLSGYGQTNKLHVSGVTAEHIADKWGLLRLRKFQHDKSAPALYCYIRMGRISFVSSFGGYTKDDGKTVEPERVRVFMTGHGVPYALDIEGDVEGVLTLIDKASSSNGSCGCKSKKAAAPEIEVFGDGLRSMQDAEGDSE